MKSLYVSWHDPSSLHQVWGPIGRLEQQDGTYRFYYTRGARLVEGFRPFPEMPTLEGVYESSELFPLFANRVLSEHRPEYQSFLRWSGFPTSAQPDPLSLLGVTEGKKVTDAVEVFPYIVAENGRSQHTFFVQGVRWMPAETQQRLATLQAKERLCLGLLPQRQGEQPAVAIQTEREGCVLGYAPNYLATELRELLHSHSTNGIALSVVQVNHDAPFQQRLLCHIDAQWPDGFRPFSEESFQPIRTDLAELHRHNT